MGPPLALYGIGAVSDWLTQTHAPPTVRPSAQPGRAWKSPWNPAPLRAHSFEIWTLTDTAYPIHR